MMARLVLLGLLAGLFFSTTFVLNELMASQNGHWFWSASGRYIFMWFILSALIALKDGVKTLVGLSALFMDYWKFWCVTGGIGFGGFYAFLCFGADHASGWIIAATFQLTAVASLIVLAVFGERLNKRIIGTSLLIFIGVLIANLGEGPNHTTSSTSTLLLMSALPAFIAGFCFPVGNQLVWYGTTKPTHHNALTQAILHITSPLMHSALNKVWLLTTGSLPLWLVLGFVIQPDLPNTSQVFNTFFVALFAGVITTGIFLLARSKATTIAQIATIDATQASEVLFAILGGMALLGTSAPSLISMIGVLMIMVGLFGFAKMQA
ncbi:Uncharacterised protein [Moraxella ovis]|uniref:Multidrug resistance efflux transporter family protein n=2 Tax=Moraxella ovis TaxID=29433 RepID=A0A378PLC4_9GAMM|nr:multidrug resistance efflux transporter family protein [Moraxella ovis]STY87572.1 Uncharacterised protein [Moraxella ovis]